MNYHKITVSFILLLLCLCAAPPCCADALGGHGGIHDGTVSGNTPPQTTPDENEPKELTAILNLNVLAIGQMVKTGDEAGWNYKISIWESNFSIACAYNDSGDKVPLELLSVDTSQVNIYEPGTYTVTVSLAVDAAWREDFFLSDSLLYLPIQVRISDPSVFDLWVNHINNDFFRATWNKTLSAPLRIEYVQSEVPLAQEDACSWDWQACPEELAFGGGNLLLVQRRELVQGSQYYFRLISGEDISNILHIVDTGTSFTCETMSGHRDGSNSDGVEFPDTSQPAPSLPEESSPSRPPANDEAAPPSSGSGSDESSAEETTPGIPDGTTDRYSSSDLSPESLTGPAAGSPAAGSSQKAGLPTASPRESGRQLETTAATEDILSGTRLLLLLDEQGCARFSKQGIVVTLSAAVLEQLNIHSEDSFRISIEKQSDQDFSCYIWLNDMPVTELDEIQVMLPCSAPQEAALPVLFTSAGEEAAWGSYDEKQGIAAFTLSHTGSYMLQEIPSPMAETIIPKAAVIPEGNPPSQTPSPLPDNTSDSLLHSPAITAVLFLMLAIMTAGILLFYKIRIRRKGL